MRKKRRDNNHQEIKEAFRNAGFSVADTASLGDGFVDLVVARDGVNILIEVKDGDKPPSKRRLTPKEAQFHEAWQGVIDVVETADDAENLIAHYFGAPTIH